VDRTAGGTSVPGPAAAVPAGPFRLQPKLQRHDLWREEAAKLWNSRYDLPMKMSPVLPVEIHVQRLPHAEGLALPSYESEGAAGADIRAARDYFIEAGGREAVSTGLIFEIPQGYEIQVRPRSGLAWKHGLTLVNAPGTIDADFRGEVMILLVNLGREAVKIRRGERVAQLLLSPVLRAAFEEVSEVGSTVRGSGGFGSTGLH